MRRFFSGVSYETLQNNTICVKEDDSIRNIRDEEDLEKSLLVFVSNLGTSMGEVYTIDPNRPVRYAVVNLNFR